MTAARRVTRTRTGALKTLGRVLLWTLVLILLARGAASLTRTSAPRATATPATRAAPTVPDPARALAVEFAREFLAHDPNRPERQDALRAYTTTDLAQAIVPDRPATAPAQAVDALTVATATVMAPGRYLVTVSARVTTRHRPPIWRQLTVPVANVGGGLVVDELPSLIAAPPRADLPPTEPEGEALTDPQISGMLERFFTDYLAGDHEAVASGPAAPGARLGATTGGLRFMDLTALRAIPGAPRGELDVTVTVRAKDPRARATLGLHYRLRLKHGDRWYVAQINPPREGRTP